MKTNIHPYIYNLFDLYNISRHLSFSDSGFFLIQSRCDIKVTIHVDYREIASVVESGTSVVLILHNQDKIIFSKDQSVAPIYLALQNAGDGGLSLPSQSIQRLKQRFGSQIWVSICHFAKRIFCKTGGC